MDVLVGFEYAGFDSFREQSYHLLQSEMLSKSCCCSKCLVGGKQFILREERELHQIEKGLNCMRDQWEANYP